MLLGPSSLKERLTGTCNRHNSQMNLAMFLHFLPPASFQLVPLVCDGSVMLDVIIGRFVKRASVIGHFFTGRLIWVFRHSRSDSGHRHTQSDGRKTRVVDFGEDP